MTRVARLLILVILVLSVGCASAEPAPGPSGRSPSAGPPTTASPPAASPEPAPSPTEIAVEPPGALVAPGVLKIGPEGTLLAAAAGSSPTGRLREGVLVPFSAVQDGWAKITTPCELTRWMPVASGGRLSRPAVVLDPGHGGNEPGATGPTGLLEKDLNLNVAARAAGLLNARGVPTALTRTSDYRASLPFRVMLAGSSSAELMISIHHNADPDGPRPTPGTETFYQYRSPESKRLAGLIYEEVVPALAALDVPWVGDTDAGAKWRLGSSGADYYGILRRSAGNGLTAVLAELSFLSNPAEEQVLRRDDVVQLEAEAIVRAVERYLGTEDAGSGFTTPYPRTAPAGSGGGTRGCVDPA